LESREEFSLHDCAKKREPRVVIKGKILGGGTGPRREIGQSVMAYLSCLGKLGFSGGLDSGREREESGSSVIKKRNKEIKTNLMGLVRCETNMWGIGKI